MAEKDRFPMVFSSLEFIFQFLPIFLLIYFLCPARYKNFCLFAGSMIFYLYGVWDTPLYLALFGASMAVNFFLAAGSPAAGPGSAGGSGCSGEWPIICSGCCCLNIPAFLRKISTASSGSWGSPWSFLCLRRCSRWGSAFIPSRLFPIWRTCTGKRQSMSLLL